MRLFNSLQSFFTVHFVVAATVPVIIFGLLADNYLAAQHHSQIEHELKTHTIDIRIEVQTLLEDVLADLRFIQRSVTELSTFNSPGKVDQILQDAASTSLYFEAIFLLDAHKRVRNVGVKQTLVGNEEDYRNLDFSGYEQVRRNAGSTGDIKDRAEWSDAYISLTSGEPSVILTLPFGAGMLIGVIDLKGLDSIIKRRIHERDGLDFAIIDRKGMLIAHTDAELARQRINLLTLHPEIGMALAHGREIDFKFHEDHSLLESVSLVPATGWVVHASLDGELAMMPLQQIRHLLIAVIAGAMLTAAAVAFWTSRRVVRPLLRLRASTQGVTRGDYHGLEQLGPENYEELNDLSENFREMGAAVMERETFLRASEERYRSLITGMGEGLLIIDRDGRITDCNEIAERIFSLSRREIVDQELLYKNWRTIGEDGEPFPVDKHPFSRTLREGVDINNQLMGLCAPDGREIWLQVNSRPQRSLHGDIHAAIITFADVTSLKVAEASLRSSKLRYQELFQQFSAVLDGITDRIDLLTPDLQVVWSNRNRSMSKEDSNRDLRSDYCYTSYGRDIHCPDCPVVRCFASGHRETGEIVDEQGRSWNLRAFPVKVDGVVTQVVLIAEDVTRQRESEKQSIRAGQLAALGELAAGVAHEINNPISGVINYAQLICNRADVNSREHDLAARIIKEGDRIATIVKELLTFAREESSEIHVVSIREALAEALTLCESPLRKEGVELRIDLPPDLPRVESRSHQIQQLFLNLISNARHALSEKYPEFHADKILLISGCAVTIDDRPGVQLKVRDHGTGIPAELIERVMNPFVTTKPAGVGTGLGLSISFEIAKKHGGTLSIASQYGDWTEVTIDLPAHASRGELAEATS